MEKLIDHAANVHSQFGEDGIVRKIFEKVGVASKVCVEFGAWDGFYLSNTANLWTNGWKGILIESDASKYDALVKNVKSHDCRCVNARVTHEGSDTLERILIREGLYGPVDLLSIDVDGDDYHIFSSLTELRPRVIICEYNPTIPVHLDLIPDPGNYFGCSALSLVKLARSKGYQLVSMTESNCFFVREEHFACFSEYDTSLQSLAFVTHLTYLMTGYAGDYVASQRPTYGCNFPSRQHFTGEHYSFPTMTILERPNPVPCDKAALLRGLKLKRIFEKIVGVFHL
jgi:hypothetical protein